MSASNCRRRANNHAVGGCSENQSRVTKAIIPLNRRRSSVTAPKQRVVLTDVTNSFRSPTRDLSAKQESHEEEANMKSPVTPVRVSARISAAKANKEDSAHLSKAVDAKGKTTSVKSGYEEVITKPNSQPPKTRGRRKSTAGQQGSEEAKSNKDNHEQQENSFANEDQQPVETDEAMGESEQIIEELETKQQTCQTRGKKTSEAHIKKQSKASSSGLQATKHQGVENRKNLRSKTVQKTKETSPSPAIDDKVLLAEEVDAENSIPRKPMMRKQTKSNAVQSKSQPNDEVTEQTALPGKETTHSKRKATEEIPEKPDLVARRSARQTKLKIENKMLSVETTEQSDGDQSNQAHDDNPDSRKAQKCKGKSGSTAMATKRSSSRLKAAESGSLVTTKTQQTKIDDLMRSPKFKSPMRSPKPSPLRRTPDTKKIPVYKSKPSKPEPLETVKDDVYDFEYDPKDVKPKRKRRAKNTEPVKRMKKPRVEPENLPPIELKLPGEEKLNTKIKAADPTLESAPPIEIELPEEVPAADLNQSIVGPPISVLPTSTPLSTSTPFISNHSSMACEPITPITEIGMEVQRERTTEVLNSVAGTVVTELTQVQSRLVPSRQPMKSKPVLPPLTLDNYFGFDETETEEEAQVVQPAIIKSTPVKRPLPVATTRPSVSPVRKALEDKRNRSIGSRPARLELVRDKVSAQPIAAPQEKKKQTTLPEFLQEVATMNRSTEEDNWISGPPTPPTVFSAPPRRSYSKQDMRKVKRAMFKEHIDAEKEDHESAEENNENEDLNPSKPKKKPADKKHKKTKQEKEADEWAKQMAQHFEDIDKSVLILSE